MFFSRTSEAGNPNPMWRDSFTHTAHSSDGVTQLDLVHTGWQELVPEDEHVRQRHDEGWVYLLGTLLRGLVETD